MNNNFKGAVFISNENGLKFDANDMLTAHLLSNADKKDVLHLEKKVNNSKAATGSRVSNRNKDKLDDGVVQEIA